MVDCTRIRRRGFIRQAGLGIAVFTFSGTSVLGCKGKAGPTGESEEAENEEKTTVYTGELRISLAQWSHHREFTSGELDPRDFASIARGYGVGAIEYVNQFFPDKARDKVFLDELNRRASDNGVRQLLIMIDNEGALASPDATIRTQAVENHYKWVEAANHLGCHSIRVNVHGTGSADEVQLAAIDGLNRLAAFSKDYGVNILVENHGGYSSHAGWLAGIMRQVNKPNVGTLPDFGNFCLKSDENDKCIDAYDRYDGIRELMPYAKAVSAKSYDFDSGGEEKTISFGKMLSIVKEANYSGYIGIEYEGERMPASEGILATKALLERSING